jgi:GTP cyclohydrolase I
MMGRPPKHFDCKIKIDGVMRPKVTTSVARVDVETAVRSIMWSIGEDPDREGLQETPARVAAAWQEWCAGYQLSNADIAGMLKTFDDGAEDCGDEMVLTDGIQFYSHCEHHMAPFFGTVTVAYIPDRKIVGLSKFARVTEAYARRLQVQERLTNQIANVIHETLQPRGVGVLVNARHFCMCSRGVNQQSSTTTTSALRGVFKKKAKVRAEFLSLARKP